MIDGKRVLAVVPARGGSKGILLKNLQPVLGIPLVARVGHVVASVGVIDHAVVSTDHAEIAAVARESGLDAPFLRPESLSGDRVADWDVLVHALLEMEKIDGLSYDIVVMLQPTSPLRRPEDVTAAIEMLVAEDCDSVWTVSETDPKNHPLKQLTVTDGALDYDDPRGAEIIARQQLAPVYHRNGVAYVMTRQCLLDQRTIKGERALALVVEGCHVSIDTRWDLDLVEYVMKHAMEAAPE